MGIVLMVGAAGCSRCSRTEGSDRATGAAPRRTGVVTAGAGARRADVRQAKITARPALATTHAAAAAWTIAEASPSEPTWTAAAVAYEAERDACEDPTPGACTDAAYAAVVARREAALAAELPEPAMAEDATPIDVPAVTSSLVAALDAYVATADPADPNLPVSKFVAMKATYRYNQADLIARLEDLLTHHRDHETAGFSANMLLDLLRRAERIDDLKRWVTTLSADAAFLADKPELQETLARLRELLATVP